MHTLEQKERHVSIWNMKWGSMIDGLEYCTGRKKSPANLNSVSRVVKFPEFIFKFSPNVIQVMFQIQIFPPFQSKHPSLDLNFLMLSIS